MGISSLVPVVAACGTHEPVQVAMLRGTPFSEIQMTEDTIEGTLALTSSGCVVLDQVRDDETVPQQAIAWVGDVDVTTQDGVVQLDLPNGKSLKVGDHFYGFTITLDDVSEWGKPGACESYPQGGVVGISSGSTNVLLSPAAKNH